MPNPDSRKTETWYEIKIQGKLDAQWLDWFNGSKITVDYTDTGNLVTSLMICVPDQAKLRGILNKIWDLNLSLLSAVRINTSNYATVQEKENGNSIHPLSG